MQSGRILPTFRQFFNASAKAGSANKDPNSQQSQQQAERDATEEEAQRAAEILQNSDEFKKSGLTAKAGSQEGRPVIFVNDSSGNALRMIRSPEIVRILLSLGMPQAPRQGRILDRRI
jgi:uncharacterized FlaG/YvyC family protein